MQLHHIAPLRPCCKTNGDKTAKSAHFLKLADNQMEDDDDDIDDLNQALLECIQVIMQVAEDGDGDAKAQRGKQYHYYIGSARKG